MLVPSRNFLVEKFTRKFSIDDHFSNIRFRPSLGFLLTLISIIFIFVQQKAWSKSAGWHGVFGILVLCISAIETIFGIFRPEKDSSWRPAFRYMHTFVGYLCYIFAVIAIGFGIQMPVSGYF